MKYIKYEKGFPIFGGKIFGFPIFDSVLYC